MITDHDDEPIRYGNFRGHRCVLCGEPTDTHLSYGRSIADRIGGNPEDYVRKEPLAGISPPEAVL